MTTAQPFGLLKAGAWIDSFRIVKALGEGANGLVLLVKRRGRHFALKLARHREGSDDVAKTNARMLRELGCLIHLDHPNIIRARAWGRFPDLIGDYCYLVLDYVDGWTLAEWLEQARPTFKQVARVFVRLAAALDYMHRRGVFHRDISLSNILIRKSDGEPFIVDLGAGDYANAQELTDGPLPPGTTRFRAPEAVRFWRENQLNWGARYDFRAADDQFALATCLYDALTDAHPAQDAKERAVPRIPVNSPTVGTPPAPSDVNPRVPAALSALAARAVEHDPASRLSTLEALRSGLEALSDAGGEAWEAPVFATAPRAPRQRTAAPGKARRRRAVAAASAVVVGAVAAFALLRHAPARPEASAPGLPAPSGGLHARAPHAPPPSPAASPAREVPLPAPMAPAQKEPPTVSAPKAPPSPPAPKPPRPTSRPTFTPEFLARCAGLGLVAAAELGCPAAPVRPERETCPKEAQEWMRRLRLPHGQEVFLMLDEDRPGWSSESAVYRTGSYMGQIADTYHPWKEGTWKVEGYLWTEGKTVVGRYTRMFPPAGAKDPYGAPLPREFPVCLVPGKDNGLPDGEEKQEGSKPGAAVLPQTVVGRFIYGEWPQP